MLEATGEWSDDHKWVQVRGGEIGLVWCCADYVTERTDAFRVTNESKRKIKIRSKPVNGKVTGYLKPGRSLTISRVVLGWGKCKSGWIDLEYLIEEEIPDV